MKTIDLLLVSIIFLFTSCNNNQSYIQEKEELINTNLNTFIESYLNKKDVSQLKYIVDENYVRKMNGVIVASNLQELKATMNIILSSFPDFKITNKISYIKDNNAFVYWTFTGTNRADFAEQPATGKKVTVNGLSHFYFNNSGKIDKEDVFYNELNLLQQLGYTLKPPVVE
jgi:steroid delta-isomerase-like uncharacterized protein